jgi:hypothetical protein
MTCWEEPLFQVSDQVLSQLEAGQVVLSHEHHLNEFDNLVCMFLKCHETEAHQLTVLFEFLGLDPAEYLDLLTCQLEGGLLEFDALARSIAEKETEVDVHQVTCDINHDVTVVSILDLQDITHKRVSGKGSAEIVARFLELLGLSVSKLLVEVINEF